MAHLQFPDLADAEDSINKFEAQFPLVDRARRVCMHADRTVTQPGRDMIRIECDYCETSVTAIIGTMIDLTPLYWWEDR